MCTLHCFATSTCDNCLSCASGDLGTTPESMLFYVHRKDSRHSKLTSFTLFIIISDMLYTYIPAKKGQ